MLYRKEEPSFSGDDKRPILVVEDDDSIGSFVVQALSQETPYNAVLASDGQQALHMIHNQGIMPRLLITDYRLPYMSGLELYDWFRSTQKLADVPAIIMSAYVPEQEIKKRALVSLNKPFELDDLLETVERLLA